MAERSRNRKSHVNRSVSSRQYFPELQRENNQTFLPSSCTFALPSLFLLLSLSQPRQFRYGITQEPQETQEAARIRARSVKFTHQ